MQCPKDVEYCWVPLENGKCPAAVLRIHCGSPGCLGTQFGNHRFRESACILYTSLFGGLGKFGTIEWRSSGLAKGKELEFHLQLRGQIQAGESHSLRV